MPPSLMTLFGNGSVGRLDPDALPRRASDAASPALSFTRPAPTEAEQLAAPAAAPTDVPVHPAAALFPMQTRGEIEELAADIKAHGQREPCVFVGDLLLDGRNRWLACQAAGVEPLRRQYDPARDGESVVAFVVSANLKRRHLKATQRAALALELAPLFEVEAQERMRRGVAAPEAPRALPAPRPALPPAAAASSAHPRVTRKGSTGVHYLGPDGKTTLCGSVAKGGRAPFVPTDEPLNCTLCAIEAGEPADVPCSLCGKPSGSNADCVRCESNLQAPPQPQAADPGADPTPGSELKTTPAVLIVTVHALPVGAHEAEALCGQRSDKRQPWVRQPAGSVDCTGCLAALGQLQPAEVDRLRADAEDLAEIRARHRESAGECERVMVALDLLPQGVPRPQHGRLAELITQLWRAYTDRYDQVRAAEAAAARPKAPKKKRDEGGRTLAKAAKTAGAGMGAVKKLAAAAAKEPAVVPLAAKGTASVEALTRVARIPNPEERTAALRELEAGAKPAAAAPPPKPAAPKAPRTLGDLAGRYVLLFSHRRGAWWRPDGRGYTDKIAEAGLYALDDNHVVGARSNPEHAVVSLDTVRRPSAPKGRR